jgi:hypothetical protein
MFFSQLLGASVIVSVGENVLDNQLVQRLSGVLGFNPRLVTSGGATSLLNSLPANLRGTVLTAYNESLRKVFQIGLIMSCLTALGAATLEWRSILKKPNVNAGAETGEAATEKNVEIDDGAKSGSGTAVTEQESELARATEEGTEKEAAIAHR